MELISAIYMIIIILSVLVDASYETHRVRPPSPSEWVKETCQICNALLSVGEVMVSPINYYIHYRICQSCDYINGLVTLDCLPGLI